MAIRHGLGLASPNPALALSALLLLAACGDPAREDTADRLENAAMQSDPAAAPLLENAADRIREGEGGDPAAEAQSALQAAGNAQASAPTRNSSTARR